MSARPSVRRARLLAAATLVVVTSAAALAPTTAFADAQPSSTVAGAAPAVNDAKPLAASLEPAAGQTPLVRDGSGADLKLTV
ncbi:hypothetical protein ACFV6F_00890, partial [Kitasatospora phosalacinea]